MGQIIPIDIEQTLHGYSDGHRLLASSTEISKEAHRTILVLSDMSGPSMQDGFEEYVTGYPLANLEGYAFSKTWFAPEMSRPGCVWTHTLILSNKTLSLLEDLRILLPLFRRPKSQLDFTDYTESIKYEQLGNTVELSRNACHPLTSAILSELYGYENDNPVALTSKEPLILENTLIAIWSQQWPKLRQQFSFCSGAMSVRLLNGKPFSFQIIPLSQRRQFERDLKDLRFVENKLTTEHQEGWINSLLEDIPKTTSTPLREFLKCFGGNTRNLLSKLTIFYDQSHAIPASKTKARDLINSFYHLFPDANESFPELVHCILGRHLGICESKILGISEYEMLFGLATYNDGNILNPSYVDANARAVQFFIDDKPKAITLMSHIIENKITPIGQVMLNSFASTISTKDLRDISDKHRGLLFALASVAPVLTANSEIWKMGHSEQLTLLETISIDKLSDLETSALITALIEAGASSISDELFSKFDFRLIESLLAFIDKHGSLPGDTNEWSNIMRNKPGLIIKWLKNHSLNSPKTFTFIAISLDPSGEVASQDNVALWARLLNHFKDDICGQDAIALSYFLMPIALDNFGQDANYLATYAFPYVHDALSKNQLNWRTWKLIEPLLPELPWHWFRSWDKCERLRMAMENRGLKDVLARNGILHNGN
jgi:hypothetical protein